MNLTLTSLNAAAGAKPAATAAPAAATEAAAPAPLAQANGGAVPAQAEQGAAPQAARAFAQWLGLAPAAPALETDAAPTEAAASGAASAAETPADEQQPAAENVLLGAMAMPLPLMPVAQATLAAVVAALPGAPASKDSRPAADTGISLPATELAPDAAAGKASAFAAPALASLAPVQAAAATAASAAPAADSGSGNEGFAAADAAQEQAAPGAERAPANSFGVAAPAPGNARSTETVALSGPPTAWRQTLQEALGERLQVQVGKGAEQAVIRLEPPMLGRVEIAIRHSAGSLEVNISATHGEVLRQLQTVSENLRNDLAQRQFMDVAVNVAPAPRSAAATPMFAGDGSGRGRQQDGNEQEQTPGNALAEAHTGAAPFSLNGRA